MSKIINSEYADRYENNKYIWENESDKNSAAARKANAENEQIRRMTGTYTDTMDYNAFRNARANHSKYYDMAASVTVNPEYKAQSDLLYDAINNFSYNSDNDPAYAAYVKAANRESNSAQKNTYANMTKASSGRNNSYAAAATAQVGQVYANKINDYANNLAEQAYNKLVKKYNASNERYKQAVESANEEYKRYMEMGDADVEKKRNQLKDERESKKSELDFAESKLDYDIKLDEYKAQLIKNNILNEKNIYEFERWKQDPNYEIKDKKLAETIGEYMGYTWLKGNARDYLYSKYYK